MTPDEIYFKVKDLVKRQALNTPEADKFFAEHKEEVFSQERVLREIAPTVFEVNDMFKDMDLEEEE